MNKNIPTKPVNLRQDAPVWAHELVKQINQQFIIIYRYIYGRSGTLTAANTAHALNSTFSDTEIETALNTLGTRINEIQTVLEERNLIES